MEFLDLFKTAEKDKPKDVIEKNIKRVETMGIISDAKSLIYMGYDEDNFSDVNIGSFIWYLLKIKESIDDDTYSIDIIQDITPFDLFLIGTKNPVKIEERDGKKIITDSDAMKFVKCIPSEFRNEFVVSLLNEYRHARYFSIESLKKENLLSFKEFVKKIKKFDPDIVYKDIYKIHPSFYPVLCEADYSKIFAYYKNRDCLYTDGSNITNFTKDLITTSGKIFEEFNTECKSIDEIVNENYRNIKMI